MFGANAKYYHRLFPAREAQLKFLSDLAELPARLLDVACGTGEYVAALDRQGYEAWGVELDPAMHAQAEQRHPSVAQTGQLILGDMRELQELVVPPYELVYCIGGSLSHLASLAEVADVLRQMWELTGRLGVVVTQTVNFDAVLPALAGQGHFDWPPLRADTPESAPLILDRRYLPNPASSGEPTVEFHTRVTCGAQVEERQTTLLALTREELQSCLPPGVRAKWYGRFDRAPWEPASPATILVLQNA